MATQKRKKFEIMKLIVLVLILTFFQLGICYTQSSAQSPPKKHEMEMLGGPGGLDMIASTTVAQIISKNHPWIRVSPVKTRDIDSHFVLAEKRDPNRVIYASNNNSYIANVLPGVAKTVSSDARWIAAWNSGIIGFVTLNPEIKSLADCTGKTIAILPGPPIGTNLVIIESFKELGIFDKITIKNMGFKEQYDALRDGLVDVALFAAFGGLVTKVFPQPFLTETLKAKDNKVYAVAWPHDILKKVFPRIGFSRPLTMIPVGPLPLQTKPVEATGIVTPALGCQAGADQKIIYEITKTLAENARKFVDYHPSFAGVTPENMVKLMPLQSEKEIHPGAIKYYKEAGIWPKAWEERHWIGPQVFK